MPGLGDSSPQAGRRTPDTLCGTLVAGVFTVHIPKKTHGEHFPDLDLQTLLLTRRGPGGKDLPAKDPRLPSGAHASMLGGSPAASHGPPLIEVLSSAPAGDLDAAGEANVGEAGVSAEPQPSEAAVGGAGQQSTPGLQMPGGGQPRYGFGQRYSGILGPLVAELPEVVDVPQPDSCTADERRGLRLAAEEAGFDEDYYL